ncbi:MAG: DUF1385 domain-containing protein [Desulfovibrionaceae bacterium]
MMRAKDRLAIAVRKPDGVIQVESRPWFSLTHAPLLKKPFVRGFPVLLETLVNGIKALNYSANVALQESGDGTDGAAGSPADKPLTSWQIALTMGVAIGAALLLFVVLPHFFSMVMKWWGLGGGVDDLSFHAWDGLFKLVMFLGYIVAISFVPDIRRVFEYHGAEHKSIWSYETDGALTPAAARGFSRLHPRCGTAFLLFVLAVSIALFAVLVPWLLTFYSPANYWLKHTYIVSLKLVLMAPVSCLAYELIKFAGRFHENFLCRVLCWPGLAMQLLTTKEPDDSQLEVAIAALKGALGEEG